MKKNSSVSGVRYFTSLVVKVKQGSECSQGRKAAYLEWSNISF